MRTLDNRGGARAPWPAATVLPLAAAWMLCCPGVAEARGPSTNMYMGATLEHGYHPDFDGKRGMMTWTYEALMTDPSGGFSSAMDFVLGGGGGGFVYDMNFLFGFGSAPDEVLGWGLTAGFGLSGITGGQLPFAFQLPVQVHVVVNLDDELHLMAFVRPYWTALAESRDRGSRSFSSFDELRAALVFGTAEIESGGSDPDEWGGFMGVMYREVKGDRIIGLFVGTGTAQGD